MVLKTLTYHKYDAYRDNLINIIEHEGYIKHHYFPYWFNIVKGIEYRYTFNVMSYKIEYMKGVKPIFIKGYYYKNMGLTRKSIKG